MCCRVEFIKSADRLDCRKFCGCPEDGKSADDNKVLRDINGLARCSCPCVGRDAEVHVSIVADRIALQIMKIQGFAGPPPLLSLLRFRLRGPTGSRQCCIYPWWVWRHIEAFVRSDFKPQLRNEVGGGEEVNEVGGWFVQVTLRGDYLNMPL